MNICVIQTLMTISFFQCRMGCGIQLIPHAAVLWLIIITQLISIDCGSITDDDQLPCDFLDSINITDGIRRKDHSIKYNNITFTKDQYAYVHENESDLTYPRGCICNVTQCVRLCCPYGEILTLDAQKRCQPHDRATDFEDVVVTDDETTREQFKNKRFGYVHERPCIQVISAEDYRITKVSPFYSLAF